MAGGTQFGLRRQNPGSENNRTGGIRQEARVREVHPERRPPVPEKVPVQVSQRGTTTETKIRPSNEFTVEEQRIQLAAVAGPLRVFAAKTFVRRFFLDGTSGPTNTEGRNQQLVKGLLAPIYVRVFPALAVALSQKFFFTEGGPGEQQTSRVIVMPDEGAFECIILPHEALFASIDDVDLLPLGTNYQLKIQVVSV